MTDVNEEEKMNPNNSENMTSGPDNMALETISINSSENQFNTGANTMNSTTKNPVLEFVLNNIMNISKYKSSKRAIQNA